MSGPLDAAAEAGAGACVRERAAALRGPIVSEHPVEAVFADRAKPRHGGARPFAGRPPKHATIAYDRVRNRLLARWMRVSVELLRYLEDDVRWHRETGIPFSRDTWLLYREVSRRVAPSIRRSSSSGRR